MPWLRGFFLFLLLLAAGCQTHHSTRESVKYIGPRATASGFTEEFVVLAHPASVEVRERRDLIQSFLDRSYAEDKRATNPPVFTVPRRFTLDAQSLQEAFRHPANRGQPTLAIDVVRLRRTDWVKDYEVTTEYLDANGRNIRSSTRRESIPIFTEWQAVNPAEPGHFPEAAGGRSNLFIRLDQFRERGGHIHYATANTNQGRLFLNLSPFLLAGIPGEDGLTLRINNETNVFCLLRIPPEALLQHSRTNSP